MNPKILGDANSEPAIQVRVMEPVPGLVEGSSVWVSGTDVSELLDSGAIVDLKTRSFRKRIWQVNGVNYTDLDTATRVATALGTVPKEIA